MRPFNQNIKRTLALARRLSAPGIAIAISLAAKADFSITGSLPRLEPGDSIQVFRENLETRSQVLIGELSVEEDYSFAGDFENEPGLYTLVMPDERKLAIAVSHNQTLALEKGTSSSNEYNISGSPDTDDLGAYETFRKDSLARLVYPPRRALNKAEEIGEPREKLSELAQLEVEGYNAHLRELNDFVINRLGTTSALYATSARWDGDYRLEELKEKIDAFAKANPDLSITKSMQERLRLFSLAAIGTLGAKLEGQSIDDQPLTLEDFLTKVTLLDFWASWCTPCRVENRHYGELLEKYSNSGFAIFAVSLDTNRKMWETASKRDGVTWPQISDLQGWKSPMAAAYNISALPKSFLLDEEGRIIAKNLRGPQLAAKLEELFIEE